MLCLKTAKIQQPCYAGLLYFTITALKEPCADLCGGLYNNGIAKTCYAEHNLSIISQGALLAIPRFLFKKIFIKK